MESFELNDHERVEIIKGFFRKYGNAIIFALIVIVLLIGAERLWSRHQESVNTDAAAAYQALLTSLSNNAPQPQIVNQANSLIAEYPKTAYANFARLFIAQVNINQNNLSQAEEALSSLVDHSSGDLQAMASVRLARVLLAENKPAEALKILASPPKGYEPLYLLLSGDSEAALNQNADARKAYQSALSSVGDNTPLRALIMQRLSSLPAT